MATTPSQTGGKAPLSFALLWPEFIMIKPIQKFFLLEERPAKVS